MDVLHTGGAELRSDCQERNYMRIIELYLLAEKGAYKV